MTIAVSKERTAPGESDDSDSFVVGPDPRPRGSRRASPTSRTPLPFLRLVRPSRRAAKRVADGCSRTPPDVRRHDPIPAADIGGTDQSCPWMPHFSLRDLK